MALFLLSWDDPVTPKAPLQLQVLQLLPQLFSLLLFLLLPAKQTSQHRRRDFSVPQTEGGVGPSVVQSRMLSRQ